MRARRDSRRTEATERNDEVSEPADVDDVFVVTDDAFVVTAMGGKVPTVELKKFEKLDTLVKTCVFVSRVITSSNILLELVLVVEFVVLFELVVELVILFKLLRDKVVLFELLLARVKTAAWNHDCPILHIRGPPL